jgi:hypothetical protein
MTDPAPGDADVRDDTSDTGGPGTATRADADSSGKTDEGTAADADDGHDYPDPGDPLSAEAALEILGEETRARIVVELGRAVRDDGIVPAPLSFSDLMDRVGAADSGRFNYHLDKLVGTFVYKTEAGYLLGPPGHFLYRAVVSGRLTDREQVEPFEVGTCPDCGEALLAEYPANSCFYVRCPTCETFQHAVELPASGFEGRTPREALTAGVRRRHHEVALLRYGVCHGCGATVERRLDDGDHEAWDDFYGYDIYAAMSCSVCSVGGFGHPALAALVTPPVVAFFHDHDRDAFGAVPWEPPLSTAKAGTVVHDDGDRATVPFELDGDRLRVTLDDDLAVATTERS